jgi:ribonuclease J
MSLDVCAIGGFSKTEGNSVAIKVDDEVILLDMGLSMENYIKFQEDLEDVSTKTYRSLLNANAVPDYRFIKDWRDKVIAIIPSHGHLDHVGAIPFAAKVFNNVPVISTPYTIEVLRSILQDEHIELENELISIELNGSYKVSDKIKVEFVNITHSILHTAILVVHTPYGKIMYANDFKLDDTPVLCKKPNYKRIKEVGSEGVKLLIMNCLYAHKNEHCASESVAKQKLKEVMLTNSKGKAMIVTTFSSHLARLKSIIEMGKKMNRKIVFLGRSLEKYVSAAERINLVNYSKDVSIEKYKDQVVKKLKQIQKEGKDKYLIVCTGHQGEPRAILSRISRGELPFRFSDGDIVIFSCAVIPVEINIQNREKLESALAKDNVKMFKGIHVSGHGHLKDHRSLIEMVKPKNIMPIHAEPAKAKIIKKLALEIGYKNTHVMEDGKRLRLG